MFSHKRVCYKLSLFVAIIFGFWPHPKWSEDVGRSRSHVLFRPSAGVFATLLHLPVASHAVPCLTPHFMRAPSPCDIHKTSAGNNVHVLTKLAWLTPARLRYQLRADGGNLYSLPRHRRHPSPNGPRSQLMRRLVRLTLPAVTWHADAPWVAAWRRGAPDARWQPLDVLRWQNKPH